MASRALCSVGQARELTSSNQLLVFDALVLNCPAVGISDFQKERALAGRMEVSEDQAGVIPSGLPTVPGKGYCLGFVNRRGKRREEKGERELTFTPGA